MNRTHFTLLLKPLTHGRRLRDTIPPLTYCSSLNCEEEDCALELLLEEFMGLVITGGHVWCNISQVKYCIWLRQDNGKLKINPESIKQTQWSAYGVHLSLFFPVLFDSIVW